MFWIHGRLPDPSDRNTRNWCNVLNSRTSPRFHWQEYTKLVYCSEFTGMSPSMMTLYMKLSYCTLEKSVNAICQRRASWKTKRFMALAYVHYVLFLFSHLKCIFCIHLICMELWSHGVYVVYIFIICLGDKMCVRFCVLSPRLLHEFLMWYRDTHASI